MTSPSIDDNPVQPLFLMINLRWTNCLAETFASKVAVKTYYAQRNALTGMSNVVLSSNVASDLF